MSSALATDSHSRVMLPAGPGSPAWPTLLAALMWLAAALSITYWGLRLAGQSDWTPVNTSLQSSVEANPVAVAMLLDATPLEATEEETPVVQTRFSLIGLVNQGGEQGAALIAIDDKPPRPYRVGSLVADGLILQSVTAKGARLAPAEGDRMALELSMPTPPEKPLLPF